MLKMMNSLFKMMSSVLKIMNSVLFTGAGGKHPNASVLAVRFFKCITEDSSLENKEPSLER